MQTGKIRYVFRNFPLESIHKFAFKAHEAAACAGDQGKYWEMHERLFENQTALEPEDLSSHGDAIGLDAATFQQCLTSGKHAAAIRADLADGAAAGVTGTPTFFLGVTNPNDGKVQVISKLVGARPYDAFKQVIDNALAEAKN